MIAAALGALIWVYGLDEIHGSAFPTYREFRNEPGVMQSAVCRTIDNASRNVWDRNIFGGEAVVSKICCNVSWPHPDVECVSWNNRIRYIVAIINFSITNVTLFCNTFFPKSTIYDISPDIQPSCWKVTDVNEFVHSLILANAGYRDLW